MGPPAETTAASNNLWVGNLASDVSDGDLMELFAQYGGLDSVTAYTSRSYAFVFFKRVDDAIAAKEALQGFSLRGSSLKIEFARPAKPCRQLWVGGISSTVMKEDLEEEFLKFGKIEDFKFLRDRNTAFIEFFRLEDASQAMRNMNGKRLGGDQLRVDFLRSQPSRREQWPDSRDAQFQGRSMGPGPADLYSIHKRHQYSTAYGGRRGEGQPSKVLWIGYPPSFHIDEQMLHNAMILFGEIEKIKSFPSRNYSFVEFRSVDEARRAKEGLQGRLFNDSRISIMFSSSDLAPGKEFYSGGNGPGLDTVFNEHSFRPLQMEMYGPNHPISNSFPGPVPPGGVLTPNMRPLGSHGRFERLLSVPELNDMATLPSYQEGNSKNIMASNWRRPSPPTLSPASSVRMHPRSASSTWDVSDINQFQRDSKRSRIDGPLPTEDNLFPLRKIDEQGLGLDQSYLLGDGGSSGSFGNVQGKNRLSPVGLRGSSQVHPDNDYIWRGIIAKGGTPVCRARCVPIGKGVGSELPEVVNCSARTGLDMLTKHYAEAIGFEIVFFLPDSEDDFASYTEFLHYLGAKNRAGVAKFDDGTTLFLVPPSEFLTAVLKVTGPERLYGVVLKFPQVSGSTLSQHQLHPASASQYSDRPQIPISQVDYGVMQPKEEWVQPMDYGRILSDETKLHPKPHFPPHIETSVGQSVSQDYVSHNAGAVSQTRLPLTPELIATLSSLLPQSSVPEIAKSSGPAVRPPVPPTPPIKVIPSPGWRQDHHSTSDHMVQLGNQFNHSGQNLSQLQSYPSVSSSTPSQHHGITQFQDSAVSQSIQSRHHNNYSVPSQAGQIVTSYQVDAPGFYNPPVPQQPINPPTMSGHSYGSNSVQSESSMPVVPEKVDSEVSNQVQKLQSAILGVGQGSSEGEVDKNQRYQSTLQFAANLLLQIQQQQQVGAQAGRGSGNQQ